MHRRLLLLILGLSCGAASLAHISDKTALNARIALGRKLFYDADLSADGSMACSACHEQRRGFADGNPTHAGVHGDPGRRNVPGLANLAYLPSYTWGDPRLRSLEAQAAIPVFGTHPVEMGMAGQEGEIVRRLSTDSCYRRMFAHAYPERGGRIDFADIAGALAAFERTLIASPPPPRTTDQKRGAAVFRQAGCIACHFGPAMSDGQFHAIDTGPDALDRGLAEITGSTEDAGRFRTPGLVNVAVTGPYLHDGSAATLIDAVARHRDSRIAPADRVALIAYLESLTDRQFLANKSYALPDQACGRRL